MMQVTDILSTVDEQVNRALARYSFWEYCLYYDQDFFTKRAFLRDISDVFQWVYDEYMQGRAQKASVSLPPRSGKSYITSLFCAWWLGKLPELSVMRNTCTSTLYDKFSYDVRNIVRSDKWANVFPAAKLAADKQNVGGWSLETARQVSYFGAGVGGTIIGFGANLAISDDLYKDMMDALSPGTQERVSMWKESAHNSRMEKNCPEIYIGTRWTKNDEIGKAQDKGKVARAITVPALIDGCSFCEEVKSTEEYLAIKNDTEESIWAAEYMQEPAEVKGLLFPGSELKYFDPADVNGYAPDHKYLYVDTSDKGDFLAVPICYLYKDRVYVVDVVFNNNGTDISIPHVAEEIIRRRMDAAEIEGNSAWILYAKDVRRLVEERYQDCELRTIKNTTHKGTRIMTHSPFVKNHFLFLKEEYRSPDYKAFIKNLTSYMREGTNKHDDSADAVAGAANYFKKNFTHLF